MKLTLNIILTALCVAFASCNLQARTILTPEAEKDYNRRLELQPQIASKLAIPNNLTPREKEAMNFLYAYLATPDVVDYPADFFLENTRLALRAAEEMPWGSTVPDREWRHFVLPVRVNNENLDNSRRVFYEELKPRVQNLSMRDAILEVNHWCHEKVSYQPSDARTSSPLATVCNALGRCGEESTFTVAALRSVGIPARQVYTPRWAHTDDNHAWVEAWADGQWYFIGACEPEAVLNLAWFNAPASRGMLMTTKVAGAYDGPEEQLDVTPISTIINVTANYAPTEVSTVIVTDPEGKPVKDATVRFSLYNYAEFYPLATKKTDSEGRAQFTSGRGDMVVWASDGKLFNLAKLTAGDSLRIALDKDRNFTGTLDFDLVPPAPGGNNPLVTPEQTAENNRRKAVEDSIRLAYVNTFISPGRANEICKELQLDTQAAELLVKSRGNHAVIEKFLRQTPPAQRNKAVALLGALAEKDLHDITPDVLADNMNFTGDLTEQDLFTQYVLNPRIANEMLRPFRQEILKSLSEKQKLEFGADPRLLEKYLSEKIATDSAFNPEGYRQSATSTMNYGIATPFDRAIAFVAICRSLGVPARIDPVSGMTQFADSAGRWIDVRFNQASTAQANLGTKGILQIENKAEIDGRQPKYYSQFTVSQIENGVPQLLEFDDFETLESINSRQQPLQPGQYILVTGQRMADGSVLARTSFFNAEAGEATAVPLTIRQDSEALQVIGSLDAEMLYTPLTFTADGPKAGDKRSILSTTGRGYYVLGIVAPGHEPSAHALNDIAAAAEEVAGTGRTLLILFPDAESATRFRISDYGNLPANVVFGADDGSIAKAIQEGLELAAPLSSDFPAFIVADSFNRIIHKTQGYSINLGQVLFRILSSLDS